MAKKWERIEVYTDLDILPLEVTTRPVVKGFVCYNGKWAKVEEHPSGKYIVVTQEKVKELKEALADVPRKAGGTTAALLGLTLALTSMNAGFTSRGNIR